jgi:DNA-binding response OmpR family regulator
MGRAANHEGERRRGAAPRPFRHLVLVLDYREPGYVLVDLRPVALQPLGWRFLLRLAETPGTVVPYKDLYDDLWGETVVEPNQLSFQKAGVLAAVTAVAPRRADLILTFPKAGFMLDLSPREVLIVPAAGLVPAWPRLGLHP